jgi:pimeloyl-ACP methyl ester carboxylesterase
MRVQASPAVSIGIERWIPNPVPFYFIGSENDTDLEAFHGEDPLAKLHQQYSALRAVEIIPHAGHMVQMERAAEVTQLMLRFLDKMKTRSS